MVFSAALLTTTTTGVSKRASAPEAKEEPIVDLQPLPAISHRANDKHDVVEYTLTNAGFIGLAGLVAGLQEAFYAFEKMPPNVTRNTLGQASFLFRIIGRKTLLGGAIGAAFSYTEASLEGIRGTDDVWNGAAGGAAAGLVYALLPPKPLPQPIAWPLAFAAVVAAADVVDKAIPHTMKGFKHYGSLTNRPSWGDPEPPRPPILDTGAGSRPWLGNFWRGA